MKLNRIIHLFLLHIVCEIHCVLYHSYFERKLRKSEKDDYTKRGVIIYCAKDILPCSDSEGRRVDGSCNNLKDPFRATANLPYDRLLPATFGSNDSLPTADDGSPLPLIRKVRTFLFPTGLKDNNHFSIIALHFAGFITLDISIIRGFTGILLEKTYCCLPQGASDPLCIPIRIPDDDPWFGKTNVRCMNMTRAQAFQDLKCVPNTVTRAPFNIATHLIDLSSVYGTDTPTVNSIRTFEDGLLQMEFRNGRYVPLSKPHIACTGNKPGETLCYKFGQPGSNFDARVTIITIWFMREHNRLAKRLSKLNPCWSDDKVFQTARQINIATLQNIHFYGWLPLMLGKAQLLKDKIIYDTKGHVNDYNTNVRPALLAEYVMATRFFHTMIDGQVRGYSPAGKPINSFSFSDQLFRPAVLEEGHCIEDLTQGTFRQAPGEIDQIFDPEMSERFFSQFQRANDLISTDLNRGRDFGMPPYYKYRKICGLHPIKKFSDLLDVMNQTTIDKLRTIYKSYKDIDFQVGLFNEKPISGSWIGPTLHCIMTKQSLIWRTGDRFWFEHGQQRTSFTTAQLAEVRKTTIGRLACDNGDTITRIQPQAFLRIGPGNRQVPCSEIPGINLAKWKDCSCTKTCPKTTGYWSHKTN